MMDKNIYNKIKSYKEYQSAKIFGDIIGSNKKVLNIGSTWGRDYFYLTENNKCNVTNLDIINSSKLPNFIRHNLDDSNLPFKNNSFDVVLISAVLEHLWNDYKIVRDIRRILKPNGKIVIHVPFIEDDEISHIRIHTLKSIKKLIEFNGFKIEEYYSGGLMLRFSYIINGLRKIPKIDITDKCIEIEKKLKFINNSKFMQTYNRSSVCYISGVKSKLKNISDVNYERFKEHE